MTTIPASEIVSVNPSVLSASGSALDVIGLILTTNTRPPIGSVLSFPDAAAVGGFFGLNSLEATLAGEYFQGFDGSNKKPGSVLFAQYNQASVPAYLRGADASAIPLATLQGFNAPLSVTIDGVLKTGTVDLSSATSFSNAAALLAEGLEIDGTQTAAVTGSMGASFTGTGTGTSLAVTSVTGVIHPGPDCVITGTGVPGATTIIAQVSGPAGGAGTYTTSGATTASSAAITSVSTTLDVTVVGSGTVGSGEVITGAGVTDDTYITALGTGTGGVGTYTTNTAQHVASTAITVNNPGIIYDSTSGAFVISSGTAGAASTITYASGAMADDLLLTQAAGASLSQGAIAAVPGSFMDAVIAQTTNWVTFMTAFDPDGGNGHTQKLAFAAWKNVQNNRFAYVCVDSDATPTTTVPATASLGYALTNNSDSGTCLIYEPTGADLAAFVCGAAASIDFQETGGRITFAFKGQAGLAPSVTDSTAAQNLGGNPQTANRGNGYNFYAAYAQASSSFIWFQRGFVTGRFSWFDSYINQIWLNSQFQFALLTLMQNSRSIPYSVAGDGLIEQALADPINAGLNFGAYGPGAISASQAASVDAAAGAKVSGVLQTQGWYLQVLPASAASRAARTTPPCTFWYLDRGSVQSINLGSVALQ